MLFAIPTVAAFVLFFIARGAILVDIMPRQKLSIDGLSVVLIAVGLSAFMVGLNDVARYPVPMAALMVAGVAVCAWFVHRQGRLDQPLLDMRPFRNKTYVMGETLIVLSYMSSIYLSLIIPLYLEGVSGFTPFVAGCLVAPAVLCYAGLCFVSGRVLGKSGAWPLVPIGFGVCLVGFVALAVSTHLGVAVAVVCCMALACAGIGAEYPAIKSVDLEVLPPELSTSGSSIHSTLVQVAGIGFVGLVRRHHVRGCASPHGGRCDQDAGLRRRLHVDGVSRHRIRGAGNRLVGGLCPTRVEAERRRCAKEGPGHEGCVRLKASATTVRAPPSRGLRRGSYTEGLMPVAAWFPRSLVS